MSEQLLEYANDEWYLNRLFVEDYQFLAKQFPGSVHAAERSYEIDGRPGHEFLLRVGEPMDASDVFGRGRSIEVGGPSYYGSLKTVKGSFRPTIVTNIAAGEGVDQIADAADLDFPDSSFSAVLAMGLPFFRTSDKPEPLTLRRDFMNEAYRVLEPGGMLLMTGVRKEDLADALELGFTLELGNGCVIAHLARLDPEPDSGRLDWDVPISRAHMNMEILLHK